MGPHRLTSPEQTLSMRSIIGTWISGFPVGLQVKKFTDKAYHSYYNVTEASHFHSAAKVDPNPANVEVEDSSAFITTAVGVATKTACKQVAY